MLAAKDSWTLTLVSATTAVALAAAGLLLTTLAPGAAPAASSAILAASLGATATAFTLIAGRVRRLELENEGLIEEISQEFQRVKDKVEIFEEALVATGDGGARVGPEATVDSHRVMVK